MSFDMLKPPITLTFGECAENHVGMQQIGSTGSRGFSCDELKSIAAVHTNAKYFSLNMEVENTTEAGILIWKNYLDADAADSLYREQVALNWDKKVFLYGSIKEKRARWNLCYAEHAQEPDYPNKKGRIVPWSDIPLTTETRNSFESVFGPLSKDLYGEGNYYFGPQCGIGFHGDSERKVVIALRLGDPMPLVFQWYEQSNPIGYPICFSLTRGDLYILSEKATGNDWKKRTIRTLRHAAGASKYIKPTTKKRKSLPKNPKKLKKHKNE